MGWIAAASNPRNNLRRMEALRAYFGPLVLAYLSACLAWVLATRLRPKLWPPAPGLSTDRQWLDLALAAAATLCIWGLNQAHRGGHLLHAGGSAIAPLAIALNQIIIFSPIVVVLAVRGQGPATVFLQPTNLPVKLISGMVLGFLASAMYLWMTGRLNELPTSLLAAVSPRSLQQGLQVFFQFVAAAFLFVRVRWSFGLAAALLVPSLLYAVVQMPRQFEAHLPVAEIAIYFVLNTLVPATILYVVQLSGDIIWFAIVSYLLVAAGAPSSFS